MKVKIKPGGQSPVQEATLMWLAYYGKPGVHFQLEIVMNDGAQAILEGLQMHSEHCWQVIRSNVTEQKQNLEHRAGDELTLGVAFDALRCVMGFDFPVAAALAFEDEYDEDEIPLSEHTPLSSLPFGAMVSDVSKGYQLAERMEHIYCEPDANELLRKLAENGGYTLTGPGLDLSLVECSDHSHPSGWF